ncbi:hypothetical protein PHISP_04307 [Aspergillus sp. HF37]|nr:hypothetical protein PHISP_04307 [Aspergillus sp. HF37]
MGDDDDTSRNQNLSSDRKNAPQNHSQCPEDDNLFVSIRRFADEQVSSMLQAVMGLPSMASSPRSDRWAVFNESHDCNNLTRHRENGDSSDAAGSSGEQGATPQNGDDNYTSSKDSQRPEPADTWNGKNRRTPENSVPDFFGFGSFFDSSWLDGHVPLPSSIFSRSAQRSISGILDGDEDMPVWPMVYILTSAYSPLRLERESRYRAHREHDEGFLPSVMSSLKSSDFDPSCDRDPAEPEWRDAFEDLLRLKYGKPMLDREPEPSRKRQSDKDWLTGLVLRGSLGEGWNYNPSQAAIWYSNQSKNGHEGENANQDTVTVNIHGPSPEKADPESELAMYERFIHDLKEREHRSPSSFVGSSILRSLLDDSLQHWDEINAQQERLADKFTDDHLAGGDDDFEKWIDRMADGSMGTTSRDSRTMQKPSSEEPSSTAEEQLSKSAQFQQPPVVSKKTTTVRHADGSVHKKTVNTRRFADGREESNETVETTNAPQGNSQDSPSSSDQDSSGKSDSSGGGWFWSR